MSPEERDKMHLKFDLSDLICKTFHKFAKEEPTQFDKPEKGWDYWATYYKFKRASDVAVNNLLAEYEIEKI